MRSLIINLGIETVDGAKSAIELSAHFSFFLSFFIASQLQKLVVSEKQPPYAS